MKTEHYLIGFLLLLLLGAYFYIDYSQVSNENKLLEKNNKIAELSVVVKEDSSRYSRLIKETNDTKDLNEFLSRENFDLKNKIKNLTSVIVADVQPESVLVKSKDMAIGDSIWQSVDTSKIDSLERVSVNFKIKRSVYALEGKTITNPPDVEFSIKQDPFKLIVTANQNDDETWATNVAFFDLNNNPYPFSISRIEGIIKPKKIEDKFLMGFGGIISTNLLAPGVQFKNLDNSISLNYKLIDRNANLSDLSWYDRFVITYYRYFNN